MPRWIALLLAVAGAPQDGPTLDRGLVRSVELAPPPGTHVQHFRLDREKARAGELPQALLRYVAGPDAEGGVRVELELEYLDGRLHVIHTEQASSARRRLVFREVRERAGRTLFLEGSPAAGYSGHELGGPEVLRRSFPAAPRAGELPLLLLEAARLGHSLPAQLSVFDPLAAAFEDLELEPCDEGGAGGDERTHLARRGDGSLRWRVTLRGQDIQSWRFQERGPLANAISPEEFVRLREAHESATRTAREAAARAARRATGKR